MSVIKWVEFSPRSRVLRCTSLGMCEKCSTADPIEVARPPLTVGHTYRGTDYAEKYDAWMIKGLSCQIMTTSDGRPYLSAYCGHHFVDEQERDEELIERISRPISAPKREKVDA